MAIRRGEARPREWAINHTPAAATQATITKAAETGRVHICTGILASFVSGTGAANRALNLRDGASGAGTVLASLTLGTGATAGVNGIVAASDLHIAGTSGTAMTLEFASAGGVASVESVTLIGYTVSA